MVKKEPRAKGSLKKRTEFTENDIAQICELGKDKYTVTRKQYLKFYLKTTFLYLKNQTIYKDFMNKGN